MKSYNFLFTKILLVKNVLFSSNNTYFTNSTIYNLTNVKTINIFSIIFKFLIFIKARTIYYVNNWVYTTNHKRIAVNYFWFVIISGICGMVLATIIRLEMAYPGVGILAGDSLQYLSVVTAHAVIMVFFMIMPLIFGAFGNFLLPTQLGVHDVAFPRLNSAAFWFLPAGLIMLCQLVCLDRRYQRMNCFNIREVEALLKTRFFPDLVNSQDYRVLLNNSMIGLRFKTNDLNSINSNMLLFHQYGLTKNSSNRFLSNFINQSSVISTYEFYETSYVNNVIFNNINKYLIGNVFYDTNLYFAEYFSPNTSSSNAITDKGYMNVVEFTSSLIQFLKSEFERDVLGFFYVSDFNKPIFVLINWFSNFRNKVLDNFLFGFLENNIGLYKHYTRNWPVTDHPKIDTESGFVMCYLTSLHHVCSISIFLWGRIIWTNFTTAWLLHASRVFNWALDAQWYWLTEAKIVVTHNFTSFTGLNLISSFMVNFYTMLVNIPTLVTTLTVNIHFFTNLISQNVNFFTLKPLYLTTFSYSEVEKVKTELNLNTDIASTKSLTDSLLWGNTEDASSFRFQRTLNPIFRYDYKLGNYFTKEDLNISPHLFTTISEVTGGIRKSSWFFSAKFVEIFNQNLSTYFDVFTGTQSSKGTGTNPYIHNTFSYYNFFNTLTDSTQLINTRWLAINSLDQKFHRMFLTSSMQQRIFSNWRQLKFTREAWRCKLLAARNQKTLYRRYVEEDGIFWLIERNAKDVLPGWAMITPFSARSKFTAIGKVDIGLMGVFLVLNSSIVASANFLVTYRYLSTLNNRKMRDARAFFAEGMLVASWMMIAANPMLAIGIMMLLCDRHWQTSFFDYSGGGDTVLFQHMFWFFGHPEVYVIMIPAFGFNNTVLSFYLRKRVSARASLMYSMYTIAFLGFFVWGHHMYMVGLSHTTRMLFSTLTVMISIPAATKLMHWCVTLVNSSFVMELPFFFMLLFIFFFVSGGVSGMVVANTGTDILFHDTFYVVGHFHVMFAGSAMFASFGAFYFYFPAIFGVKFSRIWGYLHCCYYLIGQLMTVIPMIWLGFSGMPRRVLDYPAALGGWHAVASAGHLLSVAGLMAFFIMIFDSLRQARAVTRNTFGISRFNTRLNFYIYEIARTKYLQRKGWYISRFNTPTRLKTKSTFHQNYEHFELTLFSYTFIKKNS